MDFEKLNSITKYPSILTYHEMGDKGLLQPGLSGGCPPGVELIATEKIDGTNARIIFNGADYFIGSRKELLWAKGDRIGDPALGIVEGVRAGADAISSAPALRDFPGLTVIYGEFYGGSVTKASKQYTATGKTGFRVFDIARVDESLLATLLGMELANISSWRKSSPRIWLTEKELLDGVEKLSLCLTPRLGNITLGTSHAETYDSIRQTLPCSQALLTLGAPGTPEGIVVRSSNRKHMAKLRFSDYRRALRIRR